MTEEPGAFAELNADEARIGQVRARHEAELSCFPNVVGVDQGIQIRRGQRTSVRCIVVYVARKVPQNQLAAGEVLPTELDGEPVDVVETGRIEAFSG